MVSTHILHYFLQILEAIEYIFARYLATHVCMVITMTTSVSLKSYTTRQLNNEEVSFLDTLIVFITIVE